MTLPAYIYARFSTAEQSKGTSLERQLTQGRKWVEENSWLYSADREIRDEGRSAFHGANRDEGAALFDFEMKARHGHFQNGTVLVVENIDRLSRQGAKAAAQLIWMLNDCGVTVSVWSTKTTFEPGSASELMDLFKLVLEADRSYQESKHKSDRVKAAWDLKIQAAIKGDRKAMTKILPAWLEREDKTHAMKIIPHRAKVVNEIYDWYSEGRGLPWIVQQLNSRGEPSWAYGKKDRGQGWNTAYLHKLLTNRALLGEFEPMRRSHSAVHEFSKGIIIPDFYPPIISPDKFNRIQALRQQRQRWGGPATKQMANLFSGMVNCVKCGSVMYHQSQQKAGRKTNHKSKLDGRTLEYLSKTNRSYLRCNSNRRGHACSNNKTIRYEVLEKSILDAMFDLAMKDAAFKPSDAQQALADQIAERQRLIDIKRHQIETLTENLMTVFSKSIAQKIAEIEAEVEQDETALVELRREAEVARGSTKPEEALTTLLDMRGALTSEEEDERYIARAQTHQSLKQLIEQMVCDTLGETHITLRNSDTYIHINAEGRSAALVYQGPDGEEDWNPDQVAAE